MRLSKILKSCKEFFYRKDGASGIEYALMAAMVAAVLLGFVGPISKGVTTIMDGVKTSMAEAEKAVKP